MAKLNKMAKVTDSFTVNRYENGFMMEVSGRNKKDDWVTSKILCNTEEDLVQLIKEYNSLELDN